MKIQKIVLGHIASNCYLINTNKAAIIIDAGKNSDEISDFIKNNSDKEFAILLTHRHFDHVGAVGDIKQSNKNIKVYIHTLDEAGLLNESESLANLFYTRQVLCNADVTVEDKYSFCIGDISVDVIHTPGHTQGSVCYKIGNSLFSGDTLMKQTVGRTDLPTGNGEVLKKSLKKLAKIEENLEIYPGHGENTTLVDEKKYNPYMVDVL